MQPEINYTMVGQRIRTARLQKKLSQAELGSLVGCSNNHISHIETAQTKVSLSMLSKLALALDQDLDYFLLDTQYAKRDRLIDEEIAEKLSRCNTSTLLTVNQMLDLLLKQQEMNELEKKSINLYKPFDHSFNSHVIFLCIFHENFLWYLCEKSYHISHFCLYILHNLHFFSNNLHSSTISPYPYSSPFSALRNNFLLRQTAKVT